MIVVSFVVVLGILIFVHELGHFLLAKWLGVKVEKFSLGFGPKLFGRTIGETEYLVSAFPLGGYVKMYGEGGFSETEMVDSMQAEDEPAGVPATQEPAEEIDEARSFAHKPVWARMAIVLAGPAFNMIFAWLLLICLYLVGMPIMKATVGEVLKDRPAAVAGMQKGDRIAAVNGHPVVQWEDFASRMAKVDGDVTLSVIRDGKPLTITITPQIGDSKNIFGETIKKPIIGVSPSYEFATERFGLIEAVKMGNAKAVEVTHLTVLSMVKLFQGVVPLKTVGGPLMIADMADKAAKTGGATFFMLLAVVSINLGILNLLPIPILDGGHLMFYTIEAVIRRPVSQKVREYAQQAGMLLLISLMVLAFYNDIVRYFFSKG